mmetsp:Transcript_9930/g.20526  ORF Transcript_9930/g.20526 Transcript_9930/m.20526 type:complete len:485 (-) Transcript_9930:160-1614(-)|eukprot:CAMPEP_0172456084 /NCGR_PEP_ID=MMETSP1065-20121228/14178_1 /TAXON_ID=265537 /ORGANISM="Amphiprora paludosa, Strain CCMP125" /LENGTH=484 /DNA_ID=CAMNT_0013208755 /DNA_START=6 /DNA_END=1460 /DNA_ORIENTATION=-
MEEQTPRVKSRRGRLRRARDDEVDEEAQGEEANNSRRNFFANLSQKGFGSARSMGVDDSEDSANDGRRKGSTRSLWRGETPMSPTTRDNDSSFSESQTDGTESVDMYRDELDKALLEQIDKEDTEPQGDFDPNSRWTTCVGRFLYEISPWQNWFLVEDPPYTQRTLDIPASFAPTGPWPIVGKFLSLFSAIVVLVWTFMVEENKIFCLAYLSTWNLVFFLVYMVCSLLNTMQGVSQPFSRTSGTVRICWYMFAVTTHMGILEAILYWGTEVDYNSDEKVDVSFRNLMLHGGLTLEAILDGFTVNFIPLRWMQWWGCCLLPNCIYIGWTLVHAYFLWVGNPNEASRNTIYKIISWRFEWQETLKWMLIAVFVISPVVFLALWMMSLYKWFCCCCWRRERRQYLQTTGNLEKYREMAAQQMTDAIAKAEEKLAKEREKKLAKRAAQEDSSSSSSEDSSSSSGDDDVERGQKRRLQFLRRNKGKNTE